MCLLVDQKGQVGDEGGDFEQCLVIVDHFVGRVVGLQCGEEDTQNDEDDKN